MSRLCLQKSGKTTLLGSLMNDTSGRVSDMALHVTEWELHDPVIEGKRRSLTQKVKDKFSKVISMNLFILRMSEMYLHNITS